MCEWIEIEWHPPVWSFIVSSYLSWSAICNVSFMHTLLVFGNNAHILHALGSSLALRASFYLSLSPWALGFRHLIVVSLRIFMPVGTIFVRRTSCHLWPFLVPPPAPRILQPCTSIATASICNCIRPLLWFPSTKDPIVDYSGTTNRNLAAGYIFQHAFSWHYIGSTFPWIPLNPFRFFVIH